MQTLAQAHERLNDLTNQMRRVSKGFGPDDADRAAELDQAVAAVDEVLEAWFTALNPAPVEEAAPAEEAEEAAPASAPKAAEKPAATAPAKASADDGAKTSAKP